MVIYEPESPHPYDKAEQVGLDNFLADLAGRTASQADLEKLLEAAGLRLNVVSFVEEDATSESIRSSAQPSTRRRGPAFRATSSIFRDVNVFTRAGTSRWRHM